MSADFIQHKHTSTVIAHARSKGLNRAPRGFELTREEDFINGESDIFDLLAGTDNEPHTTWRMRTI